jgi:hypothetical protein
MAVAIVAKEATTVTLMKDTSKWLGKSIGRINLARKMFQDKISCASPFLNGEPLDINVSGTFSRFALIDDVDTGLIVFKNYRRLGWGKSKLAQDGSEVPADFSSVDSGKEFSFCGTRGDNGLGLDTEGNGSAGHKEGVAGGGPFSTKIIGMGGIHDSNKVMGIKILRIGGKIIGVQVRRDRVDGDVREIGIGCRAPVDKSPVGRAAKVLRNPFERDKMDACRRSGELGEHSKGKADVNTCSNVREHKFTEEAAVCITKFGG